MLCSVQPTRFAGNGNGVILSMTATEVAGSLARNNWDLRCIAFVFDCCYCPRVAIDIDDVMAVYKYQPCDGIGTPESCRSYDIEKYQRRKSMSCLWSWMNRMRATTLYPVGYLAVAVVESGELKKSLVDLVL